jgi:hypothetical protein
MICVNSADKTEADSAQFNGKNRIFTHGRDGQWLGASLDVNKDAGIVVKCFIKRLIYKPKHAN